MRDYFIKELEEIVQEDARVMLLTADLGFAIFDQFRKKFPSSFLNVGVAEQNLIGVATGLALNDRIVYVYSIGNFPTLRCLEQIRSDAIYHNANVKIIASGAGFSYGPLGMSHHLTEDIAIMRSLPGITILSPGDDWEAGAAAHAIRSTPGVAYVRFDHCSAGNTKKLGEEFILGKARLLNEGSDATIICTGGMLKEGLGASNALDIAGIKCDLLHYHTLKPFDVSSLTKSARKTGIIVTIEEHTVEGGLGSIVAENILDQGVPLKGFQRLGIRCGFPDVVGSQAYLRKYCGISSAHIIDCVRGLVKEPTKLVSPTSRIRGGFRELRRANPP